MTNKRRMFWSGYNASLWFNALSAFLYLKDSASRLNGIFKSSQWSCGKSLVPLTTIVLFLIQLPLSLAYALSQPSTPVIAFNITTSYWLVTGLSCDGWDCEPMCFHVYQYTCSRLHHTLYYKLYVLLNYNHLHYYIYMYMLELTRIYIDTRFKP